MRTSRILLTGILTASLAASLVGCSVALTGPDGPRGSGTSSQGSTGEPAPDAGETDSGETGTELPDSNAADAAAAREEVRSIASTTVRCDGELVLEQDGAAIVIDGDCDHLLVNMDAGAVLVGNVGTLEVSGVGNLVYADAVGTLTVSGDANEVRWSGATPDVDDGGVGNILMAG
ncbi:DUF3060 family protein [Homoserinimonas aerilata]|uniref:DUF3060 family protein n=1 Tax=Homoserinimonas aerilata TaxID=1162970 RepID=A0A542YLD3_9MICO|nr:DUF3060 domain-containing protein [Homoserinimonas aerilata]TQL48754.1 DUF3060 family protein [Homoserinimonas aerilata]